MQPATCHGRMMPGRNWSRQRKASKDVFEQLSTLRMELAGVAKEIEQAHLQQLEYRERQELDEAFCAVEFAELAVIADIPLRDDVIRIELDTCQQELTACRDGYP